MFMIKIFWRRRESNPRPKTFSRKPLHAYPLPSTRSAVPEEEGNRRTSPEDVSLAGLKADPAGYPARRRFSRTAGENLRNGMPIF